MKNPGPKRNAEPRPSGILAFSWAALWTFWAFGAVASFLPNARLWGINHLAFYAWPVRIAALVVMGVSILPPTRRLVLRAVGVFPSALSQRRRTAAAALAAAAFILFNVFASSTELLGDGLYVRNNVERAAKVDPGTFAEVLRNPDRIYAGTDVMYLTATRVVSNALGLPPLAVLRVMIALFGAALVFIVAARRPPHASQGADAAALVALALFSGAMQIFFGTVEVYAPLLFFAALFVVAADRMLERGTGLWVCAVCAFCAAAMHVLGLVLLPALGILVLWTACRRERSKRFVLGTLCLGAAVCAALPIATAGRLGRFVLPVTGADGAYAVLSFDHLADAANQVLLVFPGFFVLGGVAIALRRRQQAARAVTRGARTDEAERASETRAAFPKVLFGLFLGVPSALFLLFFKPELGMARDWDLFAVTILGLWWPLYAALGRGRMEGGAREIVDAVLPPVLVMSAVLGAAWIGINAHAGRSVARFESILSYDRTHAAYAYETLASHHRRGKDLPAEIRALEKAAEASRNPRYLYALGLRYREAGEMEKAVSALGACLQVKPDYTDARRLLGRVLFFMSRWDDLIDVCEEGARLAPGDPYYPFFAGFAHAREGRTAEARSAFEMSRRLNPPPDLAGEIERALRSLPPPGRGENPGGEEPPAGEGLPRGEEPPDAREPHGGAEKEKMK